MSLTALTAINRVLMGSVCKAPSSISLMTTFTRAADNLSIVQLGYWITVSPGPKASKSL